MKNEDSIQRLWQLKRRFECVAATAPEEEAAANPPGMATRIAARWAAGALSPPTPVLWERVTAATLVVSLLICGSASWLRPKPPSAKDLMLSLFTARPAPDDGFPF